MQMMKKVTWLVAMACVNVAMAANDQPVTALNCQGLVFVTHLEAETRTYVEDFEFVMNQNKVGYSFVISGDTHLKLEIRDVPDTDLKNKKITQQVSLEDHAWRFEFTKDHGLHREQIQVQWDTLTGGFTYLRLFRGLRVDANGFCKRPLQTEEQVND
jgi:hypothetical protein